MRIKYAIFSILFLAACDPQPDDPPDEMLPATGGFLKVECPGGYLCPPNDDEPWCDNSDFRASPGGLCSLSCRDDECPGAKGAECIANYICGTPCETDLDCYDVGYGDWVVCWKFSLELSICSDRSHVDDSFSASSGAVDIDSTG